MPSVRDITDFLEAGASLELMGTTVDDAQISGPAAPGQSTRESVIYAGLTARDPLVMLRGSSAGLAIVDVRLREKCRDQLPAGSIGAVIWSGNPRLDFSRVVERFFVPPRPWGVDNTAVIALGAKIGERCYIGPGCVVSERVEIGDDTVLYGRVFLYPGTRVGNRVLIHAGAVLGADGFGFEKQADGKWQKFPHLGGVVIGDDVEIGANSTIDRGTLEDTVIERGVKIDNLVHIAHNARIGADALVIAGAVICGGAKVGEGAWVAPQSCLREKVSVGAGATIGMGAVVNTDTPADATMVGWHARSAPATKRIFSFLQRIADGNPSHQSSTKPRP